MTKLEKVIQGIECCHNIQCASCPYYNYGKTVDSCVPVLWTDVLDLLKAQQPRVLTLEEVSNCKPMLVWVEKSHAEGLDKSLCPIEITGCGTKGIGFHYGHFDYRTYNRGVYGWRCWTAKPTDEQREATPWE